MTTTQNTSKCQDSGAQVTYPILPPMDFEAEPWGRAYCGCCGQYVAITRRPGDRNEIPFYADH